MSAATAADIDYLLEHVNEVLSVPLTREDVEGVYAGGKWTTYRVMAKDAIDAAVDALDGRVPASTTHNIPLLGAEGYQAAWNKRGKIARAFGLHTVRVEHLLNRYGTLTDELLDPVSYTHLTLPTN